MKLKTKQEKKAIVMDKNEIEKQKKEQSIRKAYNS